MIAISLLALATACAVAAGLCYGAAATALPAAALTTAVSLALAVPLAVALARLHFEGRAMIYAVLVFASATSPALIENSAALPLDFAARVGLGVPLATWVVYLAARSLPPHIEDAAILDGARPLRIVAPLLRPAVLAATALVFLFGAFDLASR
jgi:ABC-type glycerol-3-phosphate transport system permease component